MDPLALLLDWWWIGPAAAGAGTVGWVSVLVYRERGARRSPSGRARPRVMSKSAARRLELDAAVLDLQSSKDAVTRSRAEVQVAQAELLRVQADRAASRTSPGAIGSARARLQTAQREARSTIADLRARRAGVRAARATLPAIRAGRAPLPLERLMARHDALTARWMAYETDAALALAYPAMTDARSALLATFLREQSQAQWLRPASLDTRIAPADFLAYRDAVRRAENAFDDAESDARRRAGEMPPRVTDPASEIWTQVATGIADNAQRALSRSAQAMARAARDRFDRRARNTEEPPTGPDTPGPPRPAPGAGANPWPVPRRDRRPDGPSPSDS